MNKCTVYRENFVPVLFSPFWPSDSRANSKQGQLIELCIKNYVTKLENGQIQDWANQFQISVGRKIRLGEFKAVCCITYMISMEYIPKLIICRIVY